METIKIEVEITLATAAELAEIFGCSEKTIGRWAREGWLDKPIKPGKYDFHRAVECYGYYLGNGGKWQ